MKRKTSLLGGLVWLLAGAVACGGDPGVEGTGSPATSGSGGAAGSGTGGGEGGEAAGGSGGRAGAAVARLDGNYHLAQGSSI
jgi:hypothetical protein